ncbi:MAG TPA: aldo/keto reductase [Bacteroidales bacterium]|nr:aldo/keto reductase [Bacteroidales bacterium]
MEDNQLHRKMGNSDLMVTPIGLGTWQFSKRKNLAGKYWPYLSDEDSYEIVQKSFKEGINWYDTAEMYGGGESERTLARALRQANISDEEVMVATKWMPFFRTARSINKTIPERKEALSGYTISLHQIHNPISFASIPSQMKAMARLVKEQQIRYVGVSNFSAKQMRKAYKELDKHGLKLVSNQVHYNMLNRRIEYNDILETARELNMAIIAYSPLAQGILTGKYHDKPDSIKTQKGFRKRMGAFKNKSLEKTRPLIEKLREIGENHDASAAQVALNWLVNQHNDLVFAIPGASNPKQAASNARAMKITLTREEMLTLDEESKRLN